MVMQVGTPNNKDKGLQGGQYARTEEELYKRRPSRSSRSAGSHRGFGPGDTGVGVRHLMPFASVPTHRHERPVGGLL
jgi:hypothetical protein